jgi:hypothetical protein
MGILRLVFAVVAGALLVGCAKTQSSPTAAQPSQTELIEAFRQAHDRRNVQAMLNLFCWDGVTPELRKLTEDSVKTSFEDKIVSIKMTSEHPKGRMNEYIRNGMTYGFNLPVVMELVVDSPSLPNSGSSSDYYPVGIRNGKYLIALMAPIKNAAVQGTVAPPSQAAEDGKSAATTNGEPVLVPAKTPFTVRLKQRVGVELLKTGGAFSAVFSDSVQVKGVIAIPAGANAQGLVTRTGKYSPQMTLTSVTVNGTPYKVTTTSIIFNEQVAYPAGSEATFDLVWPLDLRK